MDETEKVPPIQIPFSELSPEAQEGVLDDFIAREGTDYGVTEVSLDAKRTQIRRQIETGRVLLVFDPSLESVTLLTEHEWKRASALKAE
jgi:uncharacterized protein YheU (UPF0270 family)